MTERRNRLSATFVKNVKEKGRHTDGPGSHGLFLRVKISPAGRILKVFGQRLRIGGKYHDIGIGTYPMFTLRLARRKALKNAQIVAAGGDPREKEKPVPTLAEAAEIFIELRSEDKSAVYVKERRDRLRRYVEPLLEKKINQITRADVQSVLRPIWRSHYRSANMTRGLLSMVMEWAIGEGYRPDNPADDATLRSLPDVRPIIVNHKSVPHQEVEGFIAALGQLQNWDLSVIQALAFKILTATRSSESGDAMWDEIHMDYIIFKPQTKGQSPVIWPCWVIPPERSKTRQEIVIPLSRQAIRILAEAATQFRYRHPHLIFPSSRGNAASPSQLRNVQLQVSEAVPHGFRDSFKTWAQDYRVNGDISETALGHSISTHNGAYGRSVLTSIRVYLMQDWADYNHGELPSGYKWSERFVPEVVDTYPDEDILLVLEDIEVVKNHLKSDIAGEFYENVRNAFATIRSADVNLSHKLALQFRILTASDYVHVRRARLDDIDIDTGVWFIPDKHNRGKSKEALRIPLSREAIAVYKQALRLESRGDSGLLFPSKNGTVLEMSASSRLCKALRLNISPGVFITAFREWCILNGVPKYLIDDALGLTRSVPLTGIPQPDSLKQRAPLMQKWDNFLNGRN